MEDFHMIQRKIMSKITNVTNDKLELVAERLVLVEKGVATI